MWIYQQDPPALFKGATLFTPRCYAGRGLGLNSPARQGDVGIGPLPVGLYRISPSVTHPHMGLVSLQLTPSRWNPVRWRAGFWIHGDTSDHMFRASDGCLVMIDGAERRRLAAIVAAGGPAQYLQVRCRMEAMKTQPNAVQFIAGLGPRPVEQSIWKFFGNVFVTRNLVAEVKHLITTNFQYNEDSAALEFGGGSIIYGDAVTRVSDIVGIKRVGSRDLKFEDNLGWLADRRRTPDPFLDKNPDVNLTLGGPHLVLVDMGTYAYLAWRKKTGPGGVVQPVT